MSNTKFDLREDQEDDFKKLNLEIVAATNPPDATVEVLDQMYAGGVTHQITDFVVPGWRGTTSAANQEAMYRSVIAPSCRACHNSLASNITWSTAQQMEVKRFVTMGYVCLTHQMPHAVETHNRFWLSSSPHQPLVLRDFLTALNGGASLGAECTPSWRVGLPAARTRAPLCTVLLSRRHEVRGDLRNVQQPRGGKQAPDSKNR